MTRQPSSLSSLPSPSCEVLNLKSEESALYREPLSDRRWRDLIDTLRGELSQLDTGCIQALARSIIEGIESIDTTMTGYCELTCPSCRDACCTGLKVFFNQADILYLIARGEEIPPGQTRAQPTQHCRYLTAHGCSLSRTLRPYVCVWFLCEPQMELFQAESASFQRQFIKAMQDIRTFRLKIESLYDNYFPCLKAAE